MYGLECCCLFMMTMKCKMQIALYFIFIFAYLDDILFNYELYIYCKKYFRKSYSFAFLSNPVFLSLNPLLKTAYLNSFLSYFLSGRSIVL